jgi:hypothetical protein
LLCERAGDDRNLDKFGMGGGSGKLSAPNPDATPGAGSIWMAEHIPSNFRHGTASFASAADLQFTRTD